MTPLEILVATLGTGGVGKFGWDLIKARSDSRKSKVDNTVQLVDSATVYSEKLVARVDQLTTRLDESNARMDAFRAEQDERNRAQEARNRREDRLKFQHQRWDDYVAGQLRAHNIQVPDPPPLFADMEGQT